MTKSSEVLVTVSKIPTSLSIEVFPTSGKAPLTVEIQGMLLGENAHGLGAKTVYLIINGSVVDSTGTTTEVSPKGPGYYIFYIEFTEAGDYAVQTEFRGDTIYEGCDEKL